MRGAHVLEVVHEENDFQIMEIIADRIWNSFVVSNTLDFSNDEVEEANQGEEEEEKVKEEEDEVKGDEDD